MKLTVLQNTPRLYDARYNPILTFEANIGKPPYYVCINGYVLSGYVQCGYVTGNTISQFYVASGYVTSGYVEII